MVVGVVTVGCNVGMAPQGPSETEVRERAAKLPPQDQIDLIRSSPMPKAQQDKEVAEIEKKYGMKEKGMQSGSGTKGVSAMGK